MTAATACAEPSLSVIVAVDEVHRGLRRSIEDMHAALAGTRAELIVATRTPWAGAPPGVRVAVWNSASRGDRMDAAAAAATGTVLAFIDDRVRLPAGWGERVLDAFDRRDIVAAGGPVLPRSWRRSERLSAILLERHVGFTPAAHVSRKEQPRPVKELPGNNLVVRADAFEAVGGFQSPSARGQAVRLCYKLRTILGQQVWYDPALAVSATADRFPGQFLNRMASYGRTRGDLARRLPEVAPLVPYALPAAVAAALAVEIGLIPFRWWVAVKIGLACLLALYAAEAMLVVWGRGRWSDRLLAALCLPVVPLTYAFGFARGYFGPTLAEVSPVRQQATRLRVLIINWRDVSHPWAGGAEAYMHEIGRRWVAQGVEVGWLCQHHKGSRRVDVIDGIRVHRVGGRYTMYPLIPLVYMLRLRKRYDVIVDCENGIPFFTPLYSRRPKLLVVHHVHRRIFQRELKPPMRWLALWLECTLVPLVYRKTRVVAVSRSTKHELTEIGFDAMRISIVHNGVLPPDVAMSAPSLDPTILCAGRLTPQKSIDVLLRALPALLEHYPRARLEIVGQGPDRPRLERLAWSQRLAHHVRFHGYLSNSDRDAIAARSWVAVCPSAFEGWGVVCMEASARGMPVVAADVPGLRDSVRNGETGVLVPHGDASQLATALVELFSDPDRLTAMGAAGRAWAQQHTWERSASEMLDIISELEPVRSIELVGLPAREANGHGAEPAVGATLTLAGMEAAAPVESLQAVNAG